MSVFCCIGVLIAVSPFDFVSCLLTFLSLQLYMFYFCDVSIAHSLLASENWLKRSGAPSTRITALCFLQCFDTVGLVTGQTSFSL